MARFSQVAEGLRRGVEQTPERDALLTMNDSLTFAQLEPWVAGLARRLLKERAAGPGTATPVLPIRVDRSTESIIAMMACAYAEIPYVGIDAAIPTDRLAVLLKRIDSPEWMLDAATDSLPLLGEDLPMLRLGDESSLGTLVGEPFQLESVSPPDIATIILTSGTTGIPKGVIYDWPLIATWLQRRHRHPGGDFAHTRSASFSPLPSAVGSLNVLEIAIGYTIISLDPMASSMADVLARLVEVKPTKAIFTVQLARLFGRFPHPEDFPLPTVEFVNVGGEVCRYEYVKPLAKLFTANPLVLQGLSSSESIRHVQHFFRLDDAPSTGQIPLGLPYPESHVRFEPVEGTEGHFELTVAGDIARGYYGVPEATQGAFSIDDEGNHRWRTGDIVSVGPDGLLMHEGRADDLVKVSGYLVSTLGVERAVQALPGVVIATVLLKKAADRTWLEAHVELEPGSTLTAAQARQQLVAALPLYMIPTTFVRHETMPFTARGKVDREAMRLAPGMPW